MAWFKKARKPMASATAQKPSRVPEGLWVKCPDCAQILYNKDLETNLHVCPKCAHHFRIGATDRLRALSRAPRVTGAPPRLDRAGVPFISILTDPTTGGVTASFAMLGDLNIAEPKALIGFAGPRVIEQTIRQTLPEGFQRSEFLLEHGFVDFIVDRRELKTILGRVLRFMGAGEARATSQP